MMKRKRILGGLLVLVLLVGLLPGACVGSDREPPGKKLVALTFDDGPSEYTDEILDALKAHGAKATFFVGGYKVSQFEEQSRRIVEEGHQMGNHTCNHVPLAECSEAVIRQEVEGAALAIATVTGVAETGIYLRPPYGSYNEWMAEIAGVPVIWCTIDTSDWHHRDADHLVSYVSSQVRDGDIVLMHDTVESTAKGLDRLLATLEELGYEMVTVEELFWRRGITPEGGEIYFHAHSGSWLERLKLAGRVRVVHRNGLPPAP